MVSYACSEVKRFSEPQLRRLKELEELLDTPLQVREAGGHCIAIFPCGSFIFPSELEAKLLELIGKKIAILRLDGYHVRDLGGAGHD